MKIVAIVGSPRHGGNTDILVHHMIAGAEKAGASVTKYFLNDMHLTPCQGCDGCRPDVEQPCVIDDDMQAIHRDLRHCHALILGSPIYWFGLSAQFAIFLDRWYALGGDGDHALKGIRAALALAYADADPFVSGALNAYCTVRDSLNWLKGTLVGCVYASAGNPGEVLSQPEILSQAQALGEKLASP
jgi:NAD(P)H-dependent FMN reductase